MKFSRYDATYESYQTWKEICPEGTWKRVEPGSLHGLIPSDLLSKVNSVLAMGSASPQASVFVANLNRVDMSGSAVDQEPYIAAFSHISCSASGGFVHHGSWRGRTTKPAPDFFDAVAASGIQAYYPLKEMPAGASGRLEDLAVSSQRDAFWNAFSLLEKSSESRDISEKP